MNISSLLLQLVLFTGIPTEPVPPQSHESDAETSENHVGDLSQIPELPFIVEYFGPSRSEALPPSKSGVGSGSVSKEVKQHVEVERRIRVIEECIDSVPPHLKLDPNYGVFSVNPDAKLLTWQLDNPLYVVGERGEQIIQKTSLSEAFATLRKICLEGVCVPIDLYTFRVLINRSPEVYTAFIDMLKLCYSSYEKLILLFADPINLGISHEEHCIIWEPGKDFASGELRIVACERKVFSLNDRETVAGVFVNRNDARIDRFKENFWLQRGQGTWFVPAHKNTIQPVPPSEKQIPEVRVSVEERVSFRELCSQLGVSTHPKPSTGIKKLLLRS